MLSVVFCFIFLANLSGCQLFPQCSLIDEDKIFENTLSIRDYCNFQDESRAFDPRTKLTDKSFLALMNDSLDYFKAFMAYKSGSLCSMISSLKGIPTSMWRHLTLDCFLRIADPFSALKDAPDLPEEFLSFISDAKVGHFMEGNAEFLLKLQFLAKVHKLSLNQIKDYKMIFAVMKRPFYNISSTQLCHMKSLWKSIADSSMKEEKIMKEKLMDLQVPLFAALSADASPDCNEFYKDFAIASKALAFIFTAPAQRYLLRPQQLIHVVKSRAAWLEYGARAAAGVNAHLATDFPLDMDGAFRRKYCYFIENVSLYRKLNPSPLDMQCISRMKSPFSQLESIDDLVYKGRWKTVEFGGFLPLDFNISIMLTGEPPLNTEDYVESEESSLFSSIPISVLSDDNENVLFLCSNVPLAFASMKQQANLTAACIKRMELREFDFVHLFHENALKHVTKHQISIMKYPFVRALSSHLLALSADVFSIPLNSDGSSPFHTIYPFEWEKAARSDPEFIRKISQVMLHIRWTPYLVIYLQDFITKENIEKVNPSCLLIALQVDDLVDESTCPCSGIEPKLPSNSTEHLLHVLKEAIETIPSVASVYCKCFDSWDAMNAIFGEKVAISSDCFVQLFKPLANHSSIASLIAEKDRSFSYNENVFPLNFDYSKLNENVFLSLPFSFWSLIPITSDEDCAEVEKEIESTQSSLVKAMAPGLLDKRDDDYNDKQVSLICGIIKPQWTKLNQRIPERCRKYQISIRYGIYHSSRFIQKLRHFHVSKFHGVSLNDSAVIVNNVAFMENNFFSSCHEVLLRELHPIIWLKFNDEKLKLLHPKYYDAALLLDDLACNFERPVYKAARLGDQFFSNWKNELKDILIYSTGSYNISESLPLSKVPLSWFKYLRPLSIVRLCRKLEASHLLQLNAASLKLAIQITRNLFRFLISDDFLIELQYFSAHDGSLEDGEFYSFYSSTKSLHPDYFDLDWENSIFDSSHQLIQQVSLLLQEEGPQFDEFRASFCHFFHSVQEIQTLLLITSLHPHCLYHLKFPYFSFSISDLLTVSFNPLYCSSIDLSLNDDQLRMICSFCHIRQVRHKTLSSQCLSSIKAIQRLEDEQISDDLSQDFWDLQRILSLHESPLWYCNVRLQLSHSLLDSLFDGISLEKLLLIPTAVWNIIPLHSLSLPIAVLYQALHVDTFVVYPDLFSFAFLDSLPEQVKKLISSRITNKQNHA